MNKVFKIVFNAARGTRMVVNETTSSVQSGKKAAVTVAVIGALAAGTAVAADEIVVNHKHTDQVLQEAVSVTYAEKLDKNKTKNDGGKIAGVVLYQSAVDFNDGVAISVTNNGSTSADEAYGLNAQSDPGYAKAVATVSGDSSISAKSASSGAYAVFSSGPTSSVVFNSGDVSVSAEGGTEASAVWVWGGASLQGSSNLELSAKSKDAYGIVNGYYVSDSGTVDLTGDVVITATTTDANGAAYGLYTSGAGSETTMSGNVTIKALGVAGSSHLAINSENNSVVNLGSEGKTVDLTGKVYARGDSTINFNGTTTINYVLASNAAVDGISHAVDVYHSDVNFNGNTTINVSTQVDTTRQLNGVINKGGGKVTFAGDETQIKVTADKQVRSAYGVTASTEDAEVAFEGSKVSVEVVAKNAAPVYGLWSTGPSKLTSSEETSINILAQGEGEAIGIVAYGDSANVELNGDVTVVATGGDAYAAYLFDKGCASLGSAGKTVNLTGAVYVEDQSTLTLNGKTIFNGNVNVDGTLDGNAELLLGDTETTVTVDTVADNAQFTIGATGTVNDALGGKVEAVAEKFGDFADGKSVVLEEGAVMGAVTATIENGEVTGETIAVNSKTEALAEQVTLAPQMIQRIMMNDVRKRMGDLRAAEGTHGVWARYNGGQLAGSGMEADFNMVQVGIDTVPVVDAPRFGVAFSYAQTEADATNGLAMTDMDSFSLAFYGTKMYDNGMFVDVIGRMATMDTEMTVQGNKAEMDNVALSLSGELGWRFDVTDQFFIEPSAELTYTYTNADTFKMGQATYELESVDSLVGRAGFAAGFKCPANKGDVYVRAAVVHEFMGDSTMNSMINGRSATPVESDGEDTYFEYAVGAQFNVNKNTYVYADIERTEGANVDEDWRANVGVRFAF
ncbi:MAG: autotransporter outer membrane beta-barrel domain-containing protein [Burkholderiaceae bacterium]|nr:autotransporter outer membrane beta-barrel domain-containing protein [Burkholderiaceae bacterium]